MHRPCPIHALCPPDDIDGIAQPGVCGRAGLPEVLKPTEHVKMPLRWKGESGERRVHHRPSAMRTVELVVEEERATAVQEARYLKPTSRPLVLDQCVKGRDRGVERAVLRSPADRLAVPAPIRQLLVAEPLDRGIQPIVAEAK
jgi:hypothetical protein